MSRATSSYVTDLSGKLWAVPGPEHSEREPRLVVDSGYPLTGLYFVP